MYKRPEAVEAAINQLKKRAQSPSHDFCLRKVLDYITQLEQATPSYEAGYRAGMTKAAESCRKWGDVVFENPNTRIQGMVARQRADAIDALALESVPFPSSPSGSQGWLPIDLEAVKKFVDDYIAQDNRGTAWPYSYVVQDKKRIYVPDGNGDYTLYRWVDHDLFDYTKEEMLAYLRENVDDFEGDDPTEQQGVYEDSCSDVYQDVQWFFTEEEAQGHLDRNRHHYPEGRLYVKHFWRNPEAKLIMATMFALVGKDFEEEAKMLSRRTAPQVKEVGDV